MGYWGHLIATGGSRDLLGMPVLGAFGDEQTAAEGSPGWQVYYVAGAEPDLTGAVRSLAAETGVPAIAAHLEHDDDLIRTALTTESTFAENQFWALLAAFPPSGTDPR